MRVTKSDGARRRNTQQKVRKIVSRGRTREGEAPAGILLRKQIELLPSVESDPLFFGRGPRETVFEWHGDTFDLPAEATWLARGETCQYQAFRLGTCAYGLQFHLEVTPEMIDSQRSREIPDDVLAAHVERRDVRIVS